MAGIDYNDERFAQVSNNKQEALSQMEQAYGGMINEADRFYQAQIDASKDWANQQAQLQQQQTDLAIEQINQQKEQENKDYIKEQSGAYTDWQKQSNQYGVNAEQQAASGLKNTGYGESSQVSMYNTYQNRVAVAREAYKNILMNLDNGIKEAKLANSSELAEIYFKAAQQQLELSLEGFNYRNNLILEQANRQLELDQVYYGRWQDVLSQLNNEAALAEEQRQFDLRYGDLYGNLGSGGTAGEDVEYVNDDNSVPYTVSTANSFGYQVPYSPISTPIKSGALGNQVQPVNIDGGVGASFVPTAGGSKYLPSQPSSTAPSQSGSVERLPFNMESFAAAGLDKLSQSQLTDLIATGKVIMTAANGEYYFSWAAAPNVKPGGGVNAPVTMKNFGL